MVTLGHTVCIKCLQEWQFIDWSLVIYLKTVLCTCHYTVVWGDKPFLEGGKVWGPNTNACHVHEILLTFQVCWGTSIYCTMDTLWDVCYVVFLYSVYATRPHTLVREALWDTFSFHLSFPHQVNWIKPIEEYCEVVALVIFVVSEHPWVPLVHI